MFLGDHFNLRKVAWLAGLRFELKWWEVLMLFFIFWFFDRWTNLKDIPESFYDNSFWKIIFADFKQIILIKLTIEDGLTFVDVGERVIKIVFILCFFYYFVTQCEVKSFFWVKTGHNSDTLIKLIRISTITKMIFNKSEI